MELKRSIHLVSFGVLLMAACTCANGGSASSESTTAAVQGASVAFKEATLEVLGMH